MINQVFLDTFVLYARLVTYPLLAYSLLVYAWGVLADKNREFAHVSSILAVVFLMLWGASITFFITRNNDAMYDFSSIGLLPVLSVATVYLWIKICQHCISLKQQKKQMMNKKQEHGSFG